MFLSSSNESFPFLLHCFNSVTSVYLFIQFFIIFSLFSSNLTLQKGANTAVSVHRFNMLIPW
jgi:hypothetical protein